MKKIVRLTESDLMKIVKRVIKEEDEKVISNKIDSIVDSPKVEHHIENFLSNLSDDDIESLEQTLDDLGINEYSSSEEVHSKIQTPSMEMTEEDVEDETKSPKQKIRSILHNIGAANISAWGGVPLAIAIGSMTGMPIGFAASWGLTGLLIGIAKVLGKK